MNPQGSQLVNAAYFHNLTNSIQAAQSCTQLQDLVTEAFASLGALKAGINAELASLQPLLALLAIPSANPAAIVTWISNFISAYLTPMVKPTITYAAQLAELTALIASLASAISDAEKRFSSCSISIPAV